MKLMPAVLCCLLLSCIATAQTWKELSATQPRITTVTHLNGFSIVAITEEWETVELGDFGAPAVPTERHITHGRTTTYSSTQTRVQLFINALSYYQHQAAIAIGISVGPGAVSDAFNFRGNYITLSPVAITGGAIAGAGGGALTPTIPYFDSISMDDVPELRETFFETVNELRPYALRFSFGLSYGPTAAYRSINTTDAKPSYSREYAQRDADESVALGEVIEARLGLSIGYSHAIFVSPFWMRQGFNSRGDSISFHDGLPYGSARERHYRLDYLGLGLGYRYSGVKSGFNPVVELGAYLMWQNRTRNKQSQSSMEDIDLSKSITGRAENACGLRAGLGLNYRPSYRWEAFLTPTLYYNLTPLYRGAINTHLYNFGVSAGMTYYFIRMRD